MTACACASASRNLFSLSETQKEALNVLYFLCLDGNHCRALQAVSCCVSSLLPLECHLQTVVATKKQGLLFCSTTGSTFCTGVRSCRYTKLHERVRLPRTAPCPLRRRESLLPTVFLLPVAQAGVQGQLSSRDRHVVFPSRS